MLIRKLESAKKLIESAEVLTEDVYNNLPENYNQEAYESIIDINERIIELKKSIELSINLLIKY